MPDTAVTKVMPTNLAAFDEIRAEIALYKKENASLVFDYEDPKGEKDARSHVYKLRQGKSKLLAIHKRTKAEALAECRAIDAEKNTYEADFEEMIDVHMDPLRAIVSKRQEVINAEEEKVRLEKERIEQARLDAIAKREEEQARKEAELDRKAAAAAQAELERRAKIKDAEDRLAREREKFEAEKQAEIDANRRVEAAKMQAEIDKREALEQAEIDKVEAIRAEQDKARREAEAKEKAEAERVTAEKEKQEKLAEIERKRQANKKHREKIDKEVVNLFLCNKMPEDVAKIFTSELSKGLHSTLTINY